LSGDRIDIPITMIAVVGLTIAVVIFATDSDEVAGTSSARPAESINYGGFNPATGSPYSAPVGRQEQPLRYDGGPEEGTSGALSSGAAVSPAPGIRYDGGLEEGSSGAGR
jgi:hypothetical protein